MELVAKDEIAWAEESEKEGRDSDDWENVEGYAGASAGNGEKGDSEFDGIVGFFHPFWYDMSSKKGWNCANGV